MIDLIKDRRSIRDFLDKEISNQDIEEIIKAGIWAPSACNLQPVVYVIIKDKNDQKEIVEKGRAQSILLNAPVVVAVFYDKSLVTKNKANLQSASASVQNMLLCAHSKGIGSLWMAGFENNEFIRKYLHLPEKYELCALVLLGYAKKQPPAPKRNFDTFFYDRFNGNSTPDKSFLKKWKFEQVLDYQKRVARRGFKLENIKLPEVKELKKVIDPELKGKILDYHNFSGYLLSELQKDKSITGHFFSEEVKEAALMYNPILKDINLTLKPNGFYDCVCSFQKIEHVPNLTSYFKEIYNLLNPHGKLIIVTTNKSSWLGLFDFYFRIIKRKDGIGDTFYGTLINIGPWEYRSETEIKNCLKKADFDIKTISGKFTFPYYEFKESLWVQKKLNKNLVKFILGSFKALNNFCDIIYLNRLFGKDKIIVAIKK
jgi:nitroreductase/SAM-dependent methyltransferase